MGKTMIDVSRYRGHVIELEVELLTPTFLGGADQHAELRTPPLKNLLRQWWRVAESRHCNGVKDMLNKEGRLFGSVFDNEASASLVRLQADWRQLNAAEETISFDSLPHHKASRKKGPSLESYLGFGVIEKKGGKKYLKAGDRFNLTLRIPQSINHEIERTLDLANHFGTIGSRSRNGWGSLYFHGLELTDPDKLQTVQWQDLFTDNAVEYPSKLARDERGLLCWQTNVGTNWKELMRLLGTVYKELRASFKFRGNGIQPRHILGYPVTKHPVDTWEKAGGRMPSQLRLMVKRDVGNRLRGRILHLPHRLPHPWPIEQLGTELQLWKDVHAFLDNSTQLKRLGGGR